MTFISSTEIFSKNLKTHRESSQGHKQSNTLNWRNLCLALFATELLLGEDRFSLLPKRLKEFD